MYRKLETVAEFQQGDIIQVISNERNCGIDETVFTALVVDTKEDGFIAIPQDFHAHLINAAIKGACWEMSIDWLLENDVEVYLIHRFSEMLTSIYEHDVDEE